MEREDLIKGLFTIAGAITGAILTGLINRRLQRKNKTSKKLKMVYTRSILLINVAADVRTNQVQILFNGTVIKWLYQNEIALINNGNDIIEDIAIRFELDSEKSKLLNIELYQTNFDYRNDELSFSVENDRAGLITLKYLNSGDEVRFIVLTDGPSDITFVHRQPNVRTECVSDDYYISDIRTELFYDFFSSNYFFRIYGKAFIPNFKRYLEKKKSIRRSKLLEKNLHKQ